MKENKKQLAELKTMLFAANMPSITNNFCLGFCAFVDKKTLPYFSVVAFKLSDPCTGFVAPFVAPYGFKKHMPLSDAADAF